MSEIKSNQAIASTHANAIGHAAREISNGLSSTNTSQSNTPESQMVACTNMLISAVQSISAAIAVDSTYINTIANTLTQTDLIQSQKISDGG